MVARQQDDREPGGRGDVRDPRDQADLRRAWRRNIRTSSIACSNGRRSDQVTMATPLRMYRARTESRPRAKTRSASRSVGSRGAARQASLSSQIARSKPRPISSSSATWKRGSMSGERATIKARGGQDKGQRAELAAFVDACVSGAAMPISLESLAATTKATIAVRDSLLSGKPEQA